jgi:hypothetical protein
VTEEEEGSGGGPGRVDGKNILSWHIFALTDFFIMYKPFNMRLL